jgi:hypothetical protein
VSTGHRSSALVEGGLMKTAKAKRPGHRKAAAKPAKKTALTTFGRVTPVSPAIPPESRRSTAAALLKHAGKWAGDDRDEVIETVTQTRSKTRF